MRRRIQLTRKPRLRLALGLIAAAVTMVLAGCVVVPYDGGRGYYGHHWGGDDSDQQRWHQRR